MLEADAAIGEGWWSAHVPVPFVALPINTVQKGMEFLGYRRWEGIYRGLSGFWGTGDLEGSGRYSVVRGIRSGIVVTMDPMIDVAVSALVQGISAFLGPPCLQHEKMIHWQRGDFEVAVQRDAGPHVWLSTMWRTIRHPSAEIADRVETYEKGKSRHSGLKMTKWLGPKCRAQRISNVGDIVPSVIRCVRACAIDADVLESPEIEVLVSNETLQPPSAHQIREQA